MKLSKGSTMPDFTYDTAFEMGKSLYDTIDGKPTFILFLRYLGCTTCQLDIHQLKNEYHRFVEKGAQALVVLQSTPEVIAADIQKDDLPFAIICDPGQSLYKQFEIEAAKNKLGLMSVGTIKKINAAKKAGFTHGAYEGEELQLPAVFLLGDQGRVDYARYATNLADMPSHDEMLALL